MEKTSLTSLFGRCSRERTERGREHDTGGEISLISDTSNRGTVAELWFPFRRRVNAGL